MIFIPIETKRVHVNVCVFLTRSLSLQKITIYKTCFVLFLLKKVAQMQSGH